MSKVKIIIADYSVIVREGLIKIIQEEGDFEITEIDNARQLKRNLNRTNPDLLLIGSDFITSQDETAKTQSKDFETIIITRYNDTNIANPDCSISLTSSKEIIRNKVNACLKKAGLNQKTKIESNDLSKREMTILKEVALGRTSKEIAEKLFISNHTVLTHRKNIYRKLQIKTASGLTVYAILNNMITLDDLEKFN